MPAFGTIVGVTPFDFCPNLWSTWNTRVPGLSYGIACVIICLAVLTQYWLVMDGHSIYCISKASCRGKNRTMYAL